MNFEKIENLSSEEISLMYDKVLEDSINISQCFCGTDGTCTFTGGDSTKCVATTNSGGASYLTAAQCSEFCRQNCATEYSGWWSYHQYGCNDGYGDAYHYPCKKLENGSWRQFCR